MSRLVRSGKESEKKEKAPSGNVEMTWRTRGVEVEGHVEWQMLSQRGWWEARAWSWEEVEAAEASVGPSRRVRMWVWIMSVWTVEIDAGLVSSTVVDGDGSWEEEEEHAMCD